MTAPYHEAAAPELREAMAETRRIREAMAALADGWEAAAGRAEAAREGTRNGIDRMLYEDRARMLREHARQVREAAGVRS